MKKVFKKTLAMLLAVIMVLGAAPLSGFVGLELPEWLGIEASATEYQVGDAVKFGSYPQSEVTDVATLSELNKFSLDWISYGYYSGTGNWADGLMTAKDYMKYADVIYNGTKYRAVKFSEYRPGNTGGLTDADSSSQDDNGFYINTVYWFEYEPIVWRILDPVEGFVMSETIIDAQPFNNTVYYNGKSGYYNSQNDTTAPNDYENSYVNAWLNSSFIDAALSLEEMQKLEISRGEVFLISAEEARNKDYGFTAQRYDSKLQTGGTDYTVCQGLSPSSNGYAGWVFRSKGQAACHATLANEHGYIYGYFNVNNIYGIRPAVKVNLDSVDSATSSENSGINSDKGFISINETVEYFKNGKAVNIDVGIAFTDFPESSLSYNHNLAALCSQFTVIGYTEGSSRDEQIIDEDVLTAALQKLGFDNVKVDLHTGENEVNYFIASQKMDVNGEIYNLVFTGFIGSHYGQWYTNFMPGVRDTHEGFLAARDFVYKELSQYIEKHEFRKESTKILITGHSRGAATANLVAAKLIDMEYFAYADNIYTYAFATPNSTSSSTRSSEKYNRIFNIVNPEDFVTKVMPNAWGYGRYGVTLVLPSKTNTTNYRTYLNNMKPYFSTLTAGETYYPFSKGEKTTYDIVKKFTSSVTSINDFYLISGRYINGVPCSPYEYFQSTICPLIGEDGMTDKQLSAVLSLIASLITRKTSTPYDDFSRFFLVNAVLNEVNNMLSDDEENPKEEELSNAVAKIMKDFKLRPDMAKPYFADSHGAETYCAYVMTMSQADLWAYKEGYENTVNCPVDIEVIDKSTGEVVGRIVNNVVDEAIAAKETSIVMDVDGDSKSFWLPSDGDYEVKLTGNDNGTMDYTVSSIGSDTGEKERVNFFTVDIENDVSMCGEITSNDFALDEYTLTLANGETITPTEILDSNGLQNIPVNVSAEGNGYTSGNFAATSGDYVTLTADAGENTWFAGWYENGELISTDSQYSFVVKSERNLIAKFAEISIRTPSTTTISYGDSIVLHAETESTLPNGYYIEWTADNGNFSYTAAEDGTCTISPESSGETTFTAAVVDAEGNVISSDTQEMTSKAGFFQKIIAFFKMLFGLTKVIPQMFMGIY